MTWADLAVFNLLQNVFAMDNFTDIPGHEMRKECEGKFPELHELYKRVKADDRVEKWINERPETKF